MRSSTESPSSTGGSVRARSASAAAVRASSYGCIVLLLYRAIGGGRRGVAEVQVPQDRDEGVDVVRGGGHRGVAVGRQWEAGTAGPAGRLGRCEFIDGHERS